MAKKNKESIDDLLEGTEYADNKKRKHNIKKNKESLDDLLEGTEYVDNKKSNKKLRQPTLSERLAIKTYQDISPKKVRGYMEKRGIDPNFDEGFTWHDFTTDIVGDLATGTAAGVAGGAGFLAAGGPASLLTSVPTALATGTAGGTASRLGLAALAKMFGSELAPEDMGEAKNRIIKEEALASALFGAGPAKGVAQVLGRGLLKGAGKGAGYLARKVPETAKKALKDTVEPALEGMMNIEKGIGSYVDRLTKRWKKLSKSDRKKRLEAITKRSHDPGGGQDGVKNIARSVFGNPQDIGTNELKDFYRLAQKSVEENNKRLGKALKKFDRYDTDVMGGNPKKQVSLMKLGLNKEGMEEIIIGGGQPDKYIKRMQTLLNNDVKKQRNSYVNAHWNALEPKYEKELLLAKNMDKEAIANVSEFTPLKLKKDADPRRFEQVVLKKYQTLLKEAQAEAQKRINYNTVPLSAEKVHKVYTIIQQDATTVPGAGLETNPLQVLARNIRSRLVNDSYNPSRMGKYLDDYATSTRLKKNLDAMNDNRPWTITANPGTKPRKMIDPTTGLAEKIKRAVITGHGDKNASAIIDTLQEAERFYGAPDKSGLSKSVRTRVAPSVTSKNLMSKDHLNKKPLIITDRSGAPGETLRKTILGMEAAFDPGLKTDVPSHSVYPSQGSVLEKAMRSLARPIYNASRFLRQGDDFVPVGEPKFLEKTLKKWVDTKGRNKLKFPEVPIFKDRAGGAVTGAGLGYGSTFLTGADPLTSMGAGALLGSTVQRPTTALRKWAKLGQRLGTKAEEKTIGANAFFGPTTVKHVIPGTKSKISRPSANILGAEILKNILIRGEQ